VSDKWPAAPIPPTLDRFLESLAEPSVLRAGQVIRDARGKTHVIWRPPDTASPPLYPVGVADLAVGAIMGASQAHDFPPS
jgi:hypothetical protein